MELLYIWIEKYKNIENQGFNFSPKYRFKFENETLTCTENPDAISTGTFFHESENITNVTAIIGENGSGKSSVLEAIIQKISFKDNWQGVFFVFKRQEDTYYNISKTNIEINKIIHKIHGNEVEMKIGQDISVANVLITYYSTFWQTTALDKINDNPFFLLNASNFSVYLKHYQGSFKIYDQKKEESFEIGRNRYVDIAHSFYYDDLLQIILLNDNQSLKDEKNRKYMNVPFDYGVYFSIAINWVRLDNDEASKFYDTLLRQLYDKIIPQNDVDFIRISWVAAIMVVYCSTDKKGKSIKFRDKNDKEIPNDISKFIKLVSNIDTLFDVTKSFIRNEERFPLYKTKEVAKFENFKVQQTIDLLTFIDTAMIENNIKLDNTKHLPLETYRNWLNNQPTTFPTWFLFKLSKGKDLIINFLKHLQMESFPFLDVDFSQFSSGEKLLLNQFARYYQVSQKAIPDHLIFLIDEGEIGMHPQWQKEYLNRLITTLPKIFPDKKIQLILTSHSPFLVSDLPKENVIFLRKGKEGETFENGENAEGKCIVEKPTEQTFGQNIHTLFADSFFMSGGLIGEFAREKINKEVIAVINSKKPTRLQIEKARAIIKKIGEPVLRNKLKEMFEYRFEEPVNLDSEIL